MQIYTYICVCLALFIRVRSDDSSKITCLITVIDFIDLQESHGQIYECKTLETPSNVIVIKYLPYELIKSNLDAIQKGEWIISFPEAWIDSSSQTVPVDQYVAGDVQTIPPKRRLRKHNNSIRGLRETRSEHSALIVRVSTPQEVPILSAEAALLTLNSAAQQFSSCSNGDFTLVPWQKQGINGVVEVKIDQNTSFYNRNSIRWSALEKVCAALGATKDCNPSLDYGIDHVLYMVPHGTGGTGIYGFMYASLGGYFSVFGDPGGVWISRPSFEVESILHEIAHNFHVGHAMESLPSNPDGDDTESPEYGDDTGMMGSSFYLWGPGQNGNNRCFNGSNYWIMGWMKNKRLEINTSSAAVVKITGISEVGQSDQIIYVKILDLYLTYNLKRGFNDGTKEHADKLIVVQQVPWSPGSATMSTDLRAVLDDGDMFQYEDISIIVCAKDQASVSVAIGRGASCFAQQAQETQVPTANPTPWPTPLPTPVPTANPTPWPTPLPTTVPTANPTPWPTPFPTNISPTEAPSKYDILQAWQRNNEKRIQENNSLKNQLKASYNNNFLEKYLSGFNNRHRYLKGSK